MVEIDGTAGNKKRKNKYNAKGYPFRAVPETRPSTCLLLTREVQNASYNVLAQSRCSRSALFGAAKDSTLYRTRDK